MMKHKTLLTLLASASCIGAPQPNTYSPFILVEEPYNPTENESLVAANIYKRQEEQCLRNHYVETEGSQVKSFLVTEHCISGYGASGIFQSKRFKDENADGMVDLVCDTTGNTSVGRFKITADTCSDVPSKKFFTDVIRLFLFRAGENHPSLDETYQELYQQK